MYHKSKIKDRNSRICDEDDSLVDKISFPFYLRLISPKNIDFVTWPTLLGKCAKNDGAAAAGHQQFARVRCSSLPR